MKPKTLNLTPLKSLSTILAVTMIWNPVAFAAADMKLMDMSALSKPMLPLGLSRAIALSEEAVQFPGEKSLILIQDAHTNESAQINIAKSLDAILAKEKIKYVFLEAGFGDNSLSEFRDKASIEKRKEVASEYLKKGELSGAEYLDLTSDHEFKLWGVEDKALYQASLEAYKKIADNREKYQDYLKKINSSIETLKTEIYGPMLQVFDAKHSDHLKNKISITDYFDVLCQEAKNQSIPLDYYAHFMALQELKTREAGIDFKKANDEQAAVVSEFNITLEAVNAHKLSSLEAREAGAFYALLEEKIGQNNSKRFPELTKYFDYLKAAEKIDLRALIEEEKLLEEAIYRSHLVSNDEKNLYRASKMLGSLKSLFDLTMTPKEFEAYRAESGDMDIDFLTGFLNRKIMDMKKYHDRVIFLEKGYEEFVQNAQAFYELTAKRDRAFVSNLLQKMNEAHETKAVLITGGYHNPNLKALLQKEKISHVVVTPQVLRETNLKKYEKVLFGAQGMEAEAKSVTVGSVKRIAVTPVESRPVASRILTAGLLGARLADRELKVEALEDRTAPAITAPIHEDNSDVSAIAGSSIAGKIPSVSPQIEVVDITIQTGPDSYTRFTRYDMGTDSINHSVTITKTQGQASSDGFYPLKEVHLFITGRYLIISRKEIDVHSTIEMHEPLTPAWEETISQMISDINVGLQKTQGQQHNQLVGLKDTLVVASAPPSTLLPSIPFVRDILQTHTSTDTISSTVSVSMTWPVLVIGNGYGSSNKDTTIDLATRTVTVETESVSGDIVTRRSDNPEEYANILKDRAKSLALARDAQMDPAKKERIENALYVLEMEIYFPNNTINTVLKPKEFVDTKVADVPGSSHSFLRAARNIRTAVVVNPSDPRWGYFHVGAGHQDFGIWHDAKNKIVFGYTPGGSFAYSQESNREKYNQVVRAMLGDAVIAYNAFALTYQDAIKSREAIKRVVIGLKWALGATRDFKLFSKPHPLAKETILESDESLVRTVAFVINSEGPTALGNIYYLSQKFAEADAPVEYMFDPYRGVIVVRGTDGLEKAYVKGMSPLLDEEYENARALIHTIALEAYGSNTTVSGKEQILKIVEVTRSDNDTVLEERLVGTYLDGKIGVYATLYPGGDSNAYFDTIVTRVQKTGEILATIPLYAASDATEIDFVVDIEPAGGDKFFVVRYTSVSGSSFPKRVLILNSAGQKVGEVTEMYTDPYNPFFYTVDGYQEVSDRGGHITISFTDYQGQPRQDKIWFDQDRILGRELAEGPNGEVYTLRKEPTIRNDAPHLDEFLVRLDMSVPFMEPGYLKITLINSVRADNYLFYPYRDRIQTAEVLPSSSGGATYVGVTSAHPFYVRVYSEPWDFSRFRNDYHVVDQEGNIVLNVASAIQSRFQIVDLTHASDNLIVLQYRRVLSALFSGIDYAEDEIRTAELTYGTPPRAPHFAASAIDAVMSEEATKLRLFAREVWEALETEGDLSLLDSDQITPRRLSLRQDPKTNELTLKLLDGKDREHVFFVSGARLRSEKTLDQAGLIVMKKIAWAEAIRATSMAQVTAKIQIEVPLSRFEVYTDMSERATQLMDAVAWAAQIHKKDADVTVVFSGAPAWLKGVQNTLPAREGVIFGNSAKDIMTVELRGMSETITPEAHKAYLRVTGFESGVSINWAGAYQVAAGIGSVFQAGFSDKTGIDFTDKRLPEMLEAYIKAHISGEVGHDFVSQLADMIRGKNGAKIALNLYLTKLPINKMLAGARLALRATGTAA